MDLRERAKLIDHLLSELEAPTRKLTDWELKFLESVRFQWETYGRLSDKQFAVLQRIYDEKTA